MALSGFDILSMTFCQTKGLMTFIDILSVIWRLLTESQNAREGVCKARQRTLIL